MQTNKKKRTKSKPTDKAPCQQVHFGEGGPGQRREGDEGPGAGRARSPGPHEPEVHLARLFHTGFGPRVASTLTALEAQAPPAGVPARSAAEQARSHLPARRTPSAAATSPAGATSGLGGAGAGCGAVATATRPARREEPPTG